MLRISLDIISEFGVNYRIYCTLKPYVLKEVKLKDAKNVIFGKIDKSGLF